MSAARANWIDVQDPTAEELEAAWPKDLHPQARAKLLRQAPHDYDPRPTLESHGTYLFGSLTVPVVLRDEDRVCYHHVELVATEDLVLTVRMTPPGAPPLDLTEVRDAVGESAASGMVVYRLVDHVAESFLDMVDDLNDEIDELDEHIEDWPNAKIRRRLSDFRHDLIEIRHALSPTRDAVRGVMDNRVELESGNLFPRDIEVNLADSYNKLLRATEGLESARDLIAGVRDYHQSKVANDQNEVMKTLTIVAALLLLPTFIVGLYGQNFNHIPELGWGEGYGFSWFLIVVTTIGQLWYFRRKGWIGNRG